MRVLCAIFLALLVPCVAIAFTGNWKGTTYYIDATNGDDANGGTSPDDAWQTLVAARGIADNLEPGDSIAFKRGETWTTGQGTTLFFPNAMRGTAARPLRITSYGDGAFPKFSMVGGGEDQGIRLVGAEHVRISNIEIASGQDTLRSVWLRPDSGPIANVAFTNMLFDGTEENPTSGSYEGGIVEYVSFSNACPTANASIPTVRHITIDHNTFDGISSHTNEDHDVINVGRGGGGYIHVTDNQIIGGPATAIDISSGCCHRIERNFIVTDGAAASSIAIKIHSNYDHVSDVVIRGNVVAGGDNGNLIIQNISDSEISHNTLFWDNDGYTAHLGENPGACHFGEFTGNTIRNNIFYGQVFLRDEDATNGIAAANTFSNNYFFILPDGGAGENLINEAYYDGSEQADWITEADFTPWTDHATVTDDVNADPELSSPSYTDYDTYGTFDIDDSDDPVVDAGFTISDYVRDVVGAVVPAGSAQDIGAYEYIP